jgi:histidine triad (HIT) family protein
VTNGCIFCSILRREHSADWVLEESGVAAFLDIRPLFKGHVLVTPTAHAETLADLPQESIAPLFSAVQRISRAIESGLRADGSFVAINNRISQSVPHLHVHVIPRHKGDGLRGFFWPRQKYAEDAERADFAKRIRDAL